MAKQQVKTTPQSYRNRLALKRSDELFVRIMNKLSIGKLYRKPNYTSRMLAQELGCDTRHIAASVAVHTNGGNFRMLINSLKLREACRLLKSKKHAGYSVEEIGLSAGFASRQAFYVAFHRKYNVTPREFRQEVQALASAAEIEENAQATME